MQSKGEQQRDSFFLEDERITKALKTVRKAVIMRIVVMVLLIWTLFQTAMEPWIIGLMVFVLVINLAGMIPLVREWRAQKQKLDDLWENE